MSELSERTYCTATRGVHGCTKTPNHKGAHRCGDDFEWWDADE